jgi:hypothetical protein
VLCPSCASLAWQELKDGYVRINNLNAAEEWSSNWRNGEKARMVPLNLLTGSVLPLLPTIQKVAEKFRGPGGRSVRLKVSLGCLSWGCC